MYSRPREYTASCVRSKAKPCLLGRAFQIWKFRHLAPDLKHSPKFRIWHIFLKFSKFRILNNRSRFLGAHKIRTFERNLGFITTHVVKANIHTALLLINIFISDIQLYNMPSQNRNAAWVSHRHQQIFGFLFEQIRTTLMQTSKAQKPIMCKLLFLC